MKLDTIIEKTLVVVMTREEHFKLWESVSENQHICGKKLIHWLTDDGCDEMLLEGETSYRRVIIIE